MDAAIDRLRDRKGKISKGKQKKKRYTGQDSFIWKEKKRIGKLIGYMRAT